MKKVCVAILCIVMAISLCCCGVKGRLSDKYLVGYNFGDCAPMGEEPSSSYIMELRIGYDGTVDVLMMSLDDGSSYDIAGSYQMSSEDMSKLNAVLDQSKLYHLNPKENNEVLDGNCKTLYLYDKNNLVLKRCGGYMPRNEEFLEMFKTVQNVIYHEECSRIYEEWLTARGNQY